jgi:1-deoxy-D-xylulose-5-phosphate synthase
VVFALDRAGIVGEDGQTQHGVFDIAYTRILPNMKVMAPKDEEELRHMLYTAIHMDGPVTLRYPRGKALGVPFSDDLHMLEIGKAELLSPVTLEEAECMNTVLLAYGSMVAQAQLAAEELVEEGLQVAVVNARWAKPLDQEMILHLARKVGRLVTIEDHMVAGGFGSAILELLEYHGVKNVDVRMIGLPDKFVEHGAPAILKELYGLSSAHIKEVVRDQLDVERSTLTK